MLQQTQVATVIDYYHRFLKRFPTIASLAQAEESDVLQMWSGLGYYRRARGLHAGAKQVVSQFAGRFPENLESIRAIQGVGRYTAGAIASFAYDHRAPILEANTIRLFARLIGLQEPVQSAQAQKQLWQFAEEILPRWSGSGRVNQAVMELGSLVCTPKSPKCQSCPLKAHCRAYELGLELQIPLQRPKPAITPKLHVGVVVQDESLRFLLRRNGVDQWWQGLWDLPWIELPVDERGENRVPSPESIQKGFAEQLGLTLSPGKIVQTIKHAVTKYRIKFHCVTAELHSDAANSNAEQYGYFATSHMPALTSRCRRINWQQIGQKSEQQLLWSE